MTVDIICADVRDALARFPDGHFHCCVSSPPFWGLRDYGLEPTVWGGDGCEHEWGEPIPGRSQSGSLQGSTLDGAPPGQERRPEWSSAFCRRCNAWRGTLGLEPTPELYVEHLVAVMREVRRVLRDDGTLWLNLGDSYGSGTRASRDYSHNTKHGYWQNPAIDKRIPAPAKQLLGMPWRVAFALQQPYYTGRIRDERERIWLAAMVEAEGCLFIHRRKAGSSAYSRFRRRDGETVEYKRTQDTFGAGLEVSSTDRAIVERCQAIARIGSICEQSPAQNRRRKLTIYRWNVRSNECRWVIRELYSHLVAKQHEVRLLLGCPSSGPDATAAHESLKALHQGGQATIDFPPPPPLFEPGWYLRSDTIWSKKNCMPESVTDRPTRSHEYLFLLTKRGCYAYDADAVREPPISIGLPAAESLRGEGWHDHSRDLEEGQRFDGGSTHHKAVPAAGRNKRSVWEIATQPFGLEMCAVCRTIYTPAQYRRLRGGSMPRCTYEIGEDDQCCGTKWLGQDGGAVCVSCETFYSAKELERLPRAAKCRKCGSEEWLSHFAVFPEKLVEPCILAGTSEWGCCPECGAPWERVVEQRLEPTRKAAKTFIVDDRDLGADANDQGSNRQKDGHKSGYIRADVTLGWRPICKHGTEPVPCRVLDPFAGSGTVGVVAERLGRHSVLVDAKEEYCEMARHRTAQRGLMVEAAS